MQAIELAKHLLEKLERIAGEWNGDESGEQEEEADTALELKKLLTEWLKEYN